MKNALRRREIDFILPEKSCLGDALRQMEEAFKDQFVEHQIVLEDMPQIRILINGQDHMSLDGMNTILEEGDTITCLPQITGGAGKDTRNSLSS